MAVNSPRAASTKNALAVPAYWENKTPEGVYEWVRQIAFVVKQMLDGKTNATGAVTLSATATTTTLNDKRIGVNSVVVFMPTTANAASESPYVTGRGDGTCTINHASTADTDKTFNYAVHG
jgi:hypothetical protein